MSAERSVYLLTKGDGCDGDTWEIISIHSTKAAADRAKVDYESVKYYEADGKQCRRFDRANDIEEWPLESTGDAT